MTDEKAGGPLIDQRRPSTTPTPAPARWNDVPTSTPSAPPRVEPNPHAHPGKGGNR